MIEGEGGADPTRGRYITLTDETCIEIPLQAKLVEKSPFRIIETNENRRVLRGNEELHSQLTLRAQEPIAGNIARE